MSIIKICWNCVHCDTFGGICFKGKFGDKPHKTDLSNYSCDLFEISTESTYKRLLIEIKRLKEENEQLIEANFQYNLQYSKDANMIHRLRNALRQCTPGLICCNFCEGTSMTGHKENCEYIKLIGGEE